MFGKYFDSPRKSSYEIAKILSNFQPIARLISARSRKNERGLVVCTSRMIDEPYAEVDSLSKGERLKVNRGRGVPFFRIYREHSGLSEHALAFVRAKTFRK